MILFWIAIFIVSLLVMIKGADWFLDSAEKIGLKIGLSPFIVGVVIVGLGTSFPELISSIIAAMQGVTEIVTANAVGSNIANILLVIGLAAIVGKRLVVTKSLIDLDIPLLAISTVLFLGIAWDGTITLPESLLLLLGYSVYLAYTILHVDDTKHEKTPPQTILSDQEPLVSDDKKIRPQDIAKLIFGVIGLIIGAKYLIDSVITIADMLSIATGVIALVAIAFGTSLPEILVSVKAARKGKSEVALGNIFGSNVFNLLVVTGIPGLFTTLAVDTQTLSIGLPILLAATFLFIISGISKRIHMWEGSMYILVYIFFLGKLFGWF